MHSCGFDSVPSDLGVLMLHEAGGEMSDPTLVVKEGGDPEAVWKEILAEVEGDISLETTELEAYIQRAYQQTAELLDSPEHSSDLG